MNRYCLTLDLKDDPQLIEEYKAHHQNVWPEIIQSIEDSGIRHMEIHLLGNRLTMTMDVDKTFSFEKKGVADLTNNKVQEWEQLMWNYQQALPMAKPGEKWLLMEKIFEFESGKEIK